MHEDASVEKIQGLPPEEIDLYKIRHSLAHVLAQAVLSFYPTAKLGFGPPVENGFYYDFEFEQPITAEDLPKFEKKMIEIIKSKQEFVRTEMTADQATAKLQEMKQPYKAEFAQDLKVRGINNISFYQNGPFVDMCEGPHYENTIRLPQSAFKIDHIAGAYWKGSEKNKMLTRVYGLAFKDKKELSDYIARRQLAIDRDHRKIGKELDIFHIDDEIGRGMPLWLPKGAVLREELEKLAKEFEFLAGYSRVATPHITKEELFYRSGHLPYYNEGMYPPIEIDEENRKERYYLKPMNCPLHHKVFGARRHSYKELPLRFAEYGTVYRYEKSGQLSGLQRVRMLSMNDAHIYLAEEQIFSEVSNVLKMYDKVYKLFGFNDYKLRLSLHDPANKEKYYDDPAMWEKAEGMLAKALNSLGLKYVMGPGEAAFYGPKIDFQFKNLLGKEETVSTLQLDFLAAKKFDLKYMGVDGKEHDCVVIHRSPLSTHERFVSFLLEMYGGAFPTWLAPVQVRIVTVNEEFNDYAQKLNDELHQSLVRVEVDTSDESFGKKIRNGAIQKIPVVLVIGANEKDNNTVTVRRYQVKEQVTVSFAEFKADLLTEIRERHFFKHLTGPQAGEVKE